jgi:2-phospho-L-lactate transferase/gluconeogenesis factor (CofD/UPF0052 family)
MKIVLFCGGRGSTEIIKSILKIKNLDLTLAINGYDDGLSTGMVRKIIPGMLGPSDFRKNISSVLEFSNTDTELAKLLEFRMTKTFENSSISIKHINDYLFEVLDFYSPDIKKKHYELLSLYVDKFCQHIEKGILDIFSLDDMAFGNIVFSGAYLHSNSNFNQTIETLNNVLELPIKIFNVTNGSNRVLVGVTKNGDYLANESEIVNLKSHSKISEIFLLSDYLNGEQLELIKGQDVSSKLNFLRNLQEFPAVNPLLSSSIAEADLIIYGPGTQHSSLYPSYMTLGLVDLIQKNSNAVKVLIGNIDEDNDIKMENLNSLILKMEYYFNISSPTNYPIDNLIDNILLSTSASSYMPWGYSKKAFQGSIKISLGQLSNNKGKHDGNRTLNGLIAAYRSRKNDLTIQGYDRVGIVLPNLNEEKTLNIVLEKLFYFDWLEYGIIPEFIMVDGGSIDDSILIGEKFPELRIVKMNSGSGRGSAISQGIRLTDCEFIITFPTDNEYEPEAIIKVYSALKENVGSIVFGSRASLSVETNKKLKSIYSNNLYLYYLSKWGGNLITIIAGIKYQRWLSDPLTSVKGFSRISTKHLSLKGGSANWDTRIVVDASLSLIPILEVPVKFRPRSRKEGKKITVIDGFKALFELVR